LARPIAAIGGALSDIVGGRLMPLAIVNLALAGALTAGAAIAAIHYIAPLVPHAVGWLGWLYDALRLTLGAGAIVLGIALSPGVAMFIGGLLFDSAASRVEKAIGAPNPRRTGLAEGIVSGVRMAIPSLLLNLLASPLYLIPGVNALVFICINGYLMGRDFAMTAALRRMPFKDAKALRRRLRGSVFLVGVVCASLAFIAPLIAASAMTRLVNDALSTSNGSGRRS
jgi:uncharacterized protein involved in cysteine biosynthesis